MNHQEMFLRCNMPTLHFVSGCVRIISPVGHQFLQIEAV